MTTTDYERWRPMMKHKDTERQLREALAEVAALRPVHAAALNWIAEDSPESVDVIDALVDATVEAEKALQALCLHPKAGGGACPDCGATFYENG